jgi:hypothetical protein
MDPNLQAVLLWQNHQTTTPFMPSLGGAGTRAAADPAKKEELPDQELEEVEENGDEEEKDESNEEEKQGGEKH